RSRDACEPGWGYLQPAGEDRAGAGVLPSCRRCLAAWGYCFEAETAASRREARHAFSQRKSRVWALVRLGFQRAAPGVVHRACAVEGHLAHRVALGDLEHAQGRARSRVAAVAHALEPDLLGHVGEDRLRVPPGDL